MKLDPKKTVFLIDGSSLLYRGYYGVRPLHTSKGVPVQAVYNFCRMIKKLVEKFDPGFMAIVWDSKGKTTRHEMYEEYKATRQAPPSDLFDQKEHILEFANLVEIAQVSQQGIEADDLMYSIALDQIKKGNKAVFVTSDKDMGQALSDDILIFDPMKEKLVDQKAFEENAGFPVEKLPFYFALLGDASDNIPGVRGVGKKGAAEIVAQFDSLEDLYERLDEVPKARTKNALAENKDNAFLSRDLFLLQYHKTDVTQSDLAFDFKKWPNARPVFEELEFKTMLKELVPKGVKSNGTVAEKIESIKKYEFKTVTTQQQLDQLCALIKNKKAVAVDTEGDAVRPLQTNMVGISLCVQEGVSFYVPFGHKVEEKQLSWEVVSAALKPILEDPSIKKYFHNTKYDQLVFCAHGIEVQGVVFDSMIAASLITRDWQRIGLKALSEFYLDEPMLTFEEVVKQNKYPNFSHVPLDLATLYSANDAHQTFRLTKLFEKELKKEKLDELFETLEMPVSQVLYEMEKEGVFLDTPALEELGKKVEKELENIMAHIYELVGAIPGSINFNSPKQMQELLFVKLGLPPKKKSAKGTGYSTDQEVLTELAREHPVPGLILKYRELFKLKSTYIEALPLYVNPETGHVHTTFSQTRAATGRLASMDPNLQNIPADSSGYGMQVRKAFMPKEGSVFISADYSQIELRVLAHLSKDDALVTAFLEGHDVHAETASRLFGVKLADVQHEQRQIGKRINFSILYGLTPYGLSKDLGISFADAKKYIDTYFEQYPQVQEWMDGVIDQTKKDGFVTTLWGRRRYVPAIYEKNRALYEEAKRIAVNTVAQGTAAEIMKQGMINLAAALKEQDVDAQILLQIHDELLVSARATEAGKVESLVKSVLESVVDWQVPLVVTTRQGADWADVSK